MKDNSVPPDRRNRCQIGRTPRLLRQIDRNFRAEAPYQRLRRRIVIQGRDYVDRLDALGPGVAFLADELGGVEEVPEDQSVRNGSLIEVYCSPWVGTGDCG